MKTAWEHKYRPGLRVAYYCLTGQIPLPEGQRFEKDDGHQTRSRPTPQELDPDAGRTGCVGRTGAGAVDEEGSPAERMPAPARRPRRGGPFATAGADDAGQDRILAVPKTDLGSALPVQEGKKTG